MLESITRRQFLTLSTAATAYGLTPEALRLLLNRHVELEPILAQPNSILFGTSPHNNNLAEIHSLESGVKHPVQLANFFIKGFGEDTPEIFSKLAATAQRGTIPIVSFGPKQLLWYPERAIFKLVDFVNKLKNVGYPVGIRPYYEFNCTLSHQGPRAWWGNYQPTHIIRAFKTIKRVLEYTSAKDIFIILSPNATLPGFEDFQPYYPDDECVDVLSLDGYNKSLGSPFNPFNWLAEPSFSPYEIFAQDISTFKQLAPGKNWFISETNTAQPNPGPFLAQALEFVRFYGGKGLMYFGWNKHNGGSGEINWQYQLDQASDEIRNALEHPAFIHDQPDLIDLRNRLLQAA